MWNISYISYCILLWPICMTCCRQKSTIWLEKIILSKKKPKVGIHRGTNAFQASGPFRPCFTCPKLGDAGRTQVTSKTRAVFPELASHNFHLRGKFSWEDFLYTFQTFSQEEFALISQLWPANFKEHRLRYFFPLSRNNGKLWAAITRPCRLSTPLCIAIHILNRLDKRIHQVPPSICHTFLKKIG